MQTSTRDSGKISQDILDLCEQYGYTEELKWKVGTLLYEFRDAIIQEHCKDVNRTEEPMKIKDPLNFTKEELYACFPIDTRNIAKKTIGRTYQLFSEEEKSEKHYMWFIYNVAYGRQNVRGFNALALSHLRKILHLEEGGIPCE